MNEEVRQKFIPRMNIVLLSFLPPLCDSCTKTNCVFYHNEMVAYECSRYNNNYKEEVKSNE